MKSENTREKFKKLMKREGMAEILKAKEINKPDRFLAIFPQKDEKDLPMILGKFSTEKEMGDWYKEYGPDIEAAHERKIEFAEEDE